ncbi:hypothetical protein Tco_1082726 [Tanacetum coccineum]|uniref:Uncharacterized protein n=1 Tax=Tanacetum coccineum TaxID=301880 RepID=A0ABQ5I2E8_9ASTR
MVSLIPYLTSLFPVASLSITVLTNHNTIHRPLVRSSSRNSLNSYQEPRVDKHKPLEGRPASRLEDIIPYGKQVGWLCYRDGGSGGSEGDDDGSNGDECTGGAVHLARRSPAEGGDSEIGGDGDGVVMARSLSTSASNGRDMEV